LAEPLLRALGAQHFTTPTPIQAAAIPPLLAGRDLLGIAQTGTGKTAAFSLPLLQHLATAAARAAPFHTSALILAPTRELAQQIDDSLRKLGAGLRVRSVTILGGVSRSRQVTAMRGGADIVVGTPGRICDLMAAGQLRLGAARHFVLDEADRMLDLGFIRDIRHIAAALPAQRQSSLFSATMPQEVAHLAEAMLHDPVRVSIAPVAATIPKIEEWCISCRRRGSGRCWGGCWPTPRCRACWSSRVPSTALIVWPASWGVTASRWTRCTATRAGRRARGRCTGSAAGEHGCWSRPISRRAASM
jgi:ATP-dependent RNA helicase RhlE